MDIREMRVGEKETVGFDFADDLSANEYFVTAGVTLSTGLSANGAPFIGGNNNTQISQTFTVDANTSGNYYAVTFTGTTDGGHIKKKVYYIRVVTDTAPLGIGIYALLRLDEAKAYIGKVTDEDTATLERIIDNVSREFNVYTDRTLVAFSHTNVYFDGNGKEVMYLPNYPVISGANTAIYEDGILLTEGEDNDFLLYADTGKLQRINKTWYFGAKTIKATYIAGYICTGANVTLPEDLRMAALKQIAYEFGHYQHRDWGIDSVTYPDGSKTQTQQGLLKDVQVVLDGYRRYTL